MERLELKDLSKENVDWGSKTAIDLIDRITLLHHDYMKVELPRVTKLSYTIRRVHGEHHPELHQVEKTFKNVAEQIEQYVENEEEQVFPLIREYGDSKSEETLKELKQDINQLKEKQDDIKKGFEKLKGETSNYSAPEDGCQTYDLTYNLFKEIEGFLQNQFDVENKYLFPKFN